MNAKEYGKKVIQEIQKVLANTDVGGIEKLVQEILSSDRIFLYALGRVLLMMKAFAMRLVQLELDAYVVGEVTTPAAGRGDLVILGSASGETETTLLIARKAKSLGARIGTLSSNPKSRIARLSDFTLAIPAQAKTEVGGTASSIQPMSTLFEQSMLLILDVAAILLMDAMGMKAESMLSRHANLE